jgi:hypothetical protein
MDAEKIRALPIFTNSVLKNVTAVTYNRQVDCYDAGGSNEHRRD